MSKINVIYWSGTGNTEMMAEEIGKGVNLAGNQVEVIKVEDATIEGALDCDILVLGCSSMGSESLEESTMEPFMEELDDKISGKKVALFGSYGWGDGQWMREWEERVEEKGASLFEEGLMINETPDEDDLNQCKEFGERIK